MKNLKIRMKLLIGFSIVLAMLLIASCVAFFNMNTIQSQVNNYATYTVPNNNQVWQMRRDLVSVQRYLLIGLTENDDKLIADALDTQETDAARVTTTLASYLKSARVDQSLLDQLQAKLNELEPYRVQVRDLIKKNTAATNEQAFKIFRESFKPLLDEAAATLTTIGEDQNARANQQSVDARNAFRTANILLVTVILFAVLITIFVTISLTKAILRPVRQVEEASRAIANGNLNVAIDYDGKDELGVMAQNMRNTTVALKEIIADIGYCLGEMARGNFRVVSKSHERYVNDFAPVLAALRDINVNLSSTLSQINVASDQVASGSDQVSSGAQALSQGATEQASSVEELSATITEISNQVKKNAENAVAASRLVGSVGGKLTQSNEQMSELTNAMADITRSSQEIGKIIKTIEDIAFQTNILALNAAVEAARAGAAGKGFAVVADEVRNLASKSAEAAKNTTQLIEGSIKAVENGTTIADGTAKSLLQVVSGAQEIEQRVDDIAEASNQQAESIAQVTMGVDQISSVVQTNSATAEESAAASEELSGQAQMLKSLVGKFKLKEDEGQVGSAAMDSMPVRESSPSYSMSGSSKY